jgi:hypothetical protein
MSGPDQSNGQPSSPEDSRSVLANLPHTRPQRSSARRAAAREAAGAAAATVSELEPQTGRRESRGSKGAERAKAAPKRPSRAKTARTSPAKPRKAAASRRAATSARGSGSVPRQGFESEADRARGPVQPPGGTELVASAVEIVGELAKSGLATGERLLKDVFSRLSPS